MKKISYALAQINVTVGDIAGNEQKILSYYNQAKQQGADLVITPESSVTGYSPEDLVFMAPFRKAAMDAVNRLAEATKGGPALIVGCLWEEGGKTYNAAIFMDEGKIIHVQKKTVLPNHGVFDERRIYTPGGGSVFEWRGVKLGILICEDVWSDVAPRALKEQGAEIFIAINASPYRVGKRELRREIAGRVVKEHALPLLYLNIVGGQDDIIFDGGSFVFSADGELLAQLPEFEESLVVIPALPDSSSLPPSSCHSGESRDPEPHELTARDPGYLLCKFRDDVKSRHDICSLLPEQQTIWEAMKMGLADYVHKNGFSTVLLGLSGGIDSAFTAAVAVDALGAEYVKGVLMPSPYSSDHSVEDAKETAKLLGIETFTIPIEKGMSALGDMLSPALNAEGWMENIAVGGNLQSRLRGVTLMALSNQHGWMLLSTGNKSEIAVGYSTLYGDSCGSYNVIKDLYKTQVYALTKWRNGQGQVIPVASIDKPPSAELAPGQLDSDQLPPYEVLDKILHCHIEQRLGVEEIVEVGFDEQMVRKILHLVLTSEYKRRQSCPGAKLSTMLFGKDRRFPLTNKF